MFSPLQAIVLIILMEMYTAFPQRGIAGASPMISAVGEIGLILLPLLVAFYSARKTLKTAADTAGRGEILAHFDQRMARLRMATCGLVAVNLWILDFGHLVWHDWGFKQIRIAAQAIWLLPILLVWVGLWSVSHWVHRVDRRSLVRDEPAGATQIPTHPFPGWLAYIFMNVRGQLPFILFILLADQFLRTALGGLNNYGLQSYATATSLLAMLLLFVAMPWLLVRFWDTRPLPAGPLRTELESLAAKWNIRFTDIRIINTYYLVPNAAVLGPGRVARYFLITDLLLETLSREELLAVFAHEVGHAHHRHVIRYIMALTAIEWITGALTGLAMTHWPGHDALFNSLDVALIGVAFLVGFSRISRQCEHQADWFAARHMADIYSHALSPAPPPIMVAIPDLATVAMPAQHLPWMLQLDHPAESPVSGAGYPHPSPLEAGASVMADALMHLSAITRRSVNKPDWMHPSIRDRVNLLFRLARSRQERDRFERRMKRVNRLVVGLVALAILLTLLPG